jgi:hypothetical protein
MQMRRPGEGGGDDGDYDGDNGDDGGEGGDPGPGGSYRRLAVVKTIPLEEGEELPTHSPTQPGKLVIVKAGKRQGALAWLEKESDIPHARETPGTGGPEAQRAGHWVPVEPEEGEDEAEFAYVFHVDESFGKQGATPQPQPAAGQRPR